jgi:hypothetical protein
MYDRSREALPESGSATGVEKYDWRRDVRLKSGCMAGAVMCNPSGDV